MENENNNVQEGQDTTYHYGRNENPYGREDVSGRIVTEENYSSDDGNVYNQNEKTKSDSIRNEATQIPQNEQAQIGEEQNNAPQSTKTQNEMTQNQASQSGALQSSMPQRQEIQNAGGQHTAESSPDRGNPYSQGSVYGQGIYTGNDFAVQEAVQAQKEKKTKKKSNGKGKKVVGFIASAAAFGLIAGGVMVGVNTAGNRLLGNNNAKTAEIATVVTSSDTGKQVTSTSSVADVAEEVMPSIVSITNKSVQTVRSWFQSYEQEVSGSGSGIIIGQSNDEIMIVTNNHVIEGAKELTVSFCDQSAVEATVKGADSAMDLAVLTVKTKDMTDETLKAIKVAAMGSSDNLRVGDSVIAIGNALGYGQSLTVGYVSALNREVDMEDKTMMLLQTDAAINPGNSGGALLNAKGEVIGINTVKFVDSTVEGMGYAIPISVAIPIVNDLMNHEVIEESEQGYLGIQGNTITDDYANSFNMPKGIYVVKIIEGSPADQCGLKAGDIITKFAGRDVTTYQNLQSVLANKKAGEKVDMVVQRNNEKGEYEEVNLSVTLGAKKDMPSNEGSQDDKKDHQSEFEEEFPDDGSGQESEQFMYPEDFFDFFGN